METPKRVLVVDDEPHMLRISEFSIRKAGYATLTARNGRDAVRLARSEQPALIIMDVTMPEMDGIAALAELKATPETAAIPVIMLTARGHALTRHEAANSGAALYITKPFSPNALAAEARRIIEAGTPPPMGTTPG